jgi:hypothetical protein
VYIVPSLQTVFVAVGSDKPERHLEVGFCHLFDGKPLVGPKPDDDAGHHLDDRHRGQLHVVDREGAFLGAVAQDGAQLLLVGGAQLQDRREPLLRQAAQLEIGELGRMPPRDMEAYVVSDIGREPRGRIAVNKRSSLVGK